MYKGRVAEPPLRPYEGHIRMEKEHAVDASGAGTAQCKVRPEEKPLVEELS